MSEKKYSKIKQKVKQIKSQCSRENVDPVRNARQLPWQGSTLPLSYTREQENIFLF